MPNEFTHYLASIAEGPGRKLEIRFNGLMPIIQHPDSVPVLIRAILGRLQRALSSLRDSVTGLDVSSDAWAQNPSEHLRERPDALELAVCSIANAARFLRDDCNIPSPEFLPYALQLVLLGEAFRLSNGPQRNSGAY